MGIFNSFRNAFRQQSNNQSNMNGNNNINNNDNNISDEMRRLQEQQQRLNQMQNNANDIYNRANKSNYKSYNVAIYDSFGKKTICTIDDNNRNQFFHLMQSIEIENNKINSRIMELEQQMRPFLNNIEIAKQQLNNGQISEEQYYLIDYNNSNNCYNMKLEYEANKYYYSQNLSFLQYLNGYPAKFVDDTQNNNNYLYTRTLDDIKRDFEFIKLYVQSNMMTQGKNR